MDERPETNDKFYDKYEPKVQDKLKYKIMINGEEVELLMRYSGDGKFTIYYTGVEYTYDPVKDTITPGGEFLKPKSNEYTASQALLIAEQNGANIEQNVGKTNKTSGGKTKKTKKSRKAKKSKKSKKTRKS